MQKAAEALNSAPLCVIVDGGGTSTRARVFSCLDGSLIGSAESGESNATDIGIEACVLTVLPTIREAAGAHTKPFAVVWCGLAGADDQATCDRVHKAFLDLAPDLVAKPQHLLVTNDCDLLAAAIPAHGAKAGVVLIAGTGSNAMAFRPSLNPTKLFPYDACGRIGGWGHILGDEGSAYWLGREALRRVLAHRFDSQPAAISSHLNAPEDALISDLLTLVGSADIDDLLADIHAGSDDDIKARIASVAPLITQYAYGTVLNKSSFAIDILYEACTFHARAAASLTDHALANFSSEDTLLILGGSVFTKCPPVANQTRLLCRPARGLIDKVVIVEDAAALAGQALTRLWRERAAS